MIRTFKAQTNITVESDTAWKTISSRHFVKDFLPEIGRHIRSSDLFYLAMHKNGLEVMPAYVVPNKTIHWNNNAITSIALAKSDLNVAIHHIEISLETKNNSSLVTIEVEYNSFIGANFMLINNVIKTLFTYKLTVLKQDLETGKQLEPGLQAVFG